MSTRVLALGQREAGDDAVGLLICDELQRRHPELRVGHLDDPTHLVLELEQSSHVVLIDAVVGAGPIGAVLTLSPEELAALPRSPVSSHGLSVEQALTLARTLNPDRQVKVDIVAVSIEPPRALGEPTSERVLSAIPAAVARVFELCQRGASDA